MVHTLYEWKQFRRVIANSVEVERLLTKSGRLEVDFKKFCV